MLTLVACHRISPSGDASPAASAAPTSSTLAAADASIEADAPSPKDLADAHRDAMAKLADDGKYDEVCAGTPAVPRPICNWVALRAQGKAAVKPDGSIFMAFFNREHFKKVSGTIIGDGEAKGEYEVMAYGYRRHCILSTTSTNFKTTGAFTMWVQEQPDLREVTVNSGETQKWAELEESDMAKDFADLARGYGIEAEGTAKDLMTEIARFVPYAELQGDFPDAGTAGPTGVRPPPVGASGAATAATAGAATSAAKASPPPRVPTLRQGTTTVNGRLPPEVIQRIVRQNFSRFKACYQDGLRTNPSLQGRVAVKFVISRDGSVGSPQDGGSDLPDPTVVQCVVRGFGSLVFPQPEGGTVSVVYPLIFGTGGT